MIWMSLVLVYGLLKGAREIAKKKAMQKNSVIEVLFVYTLLSFVFVIPQAKNAGGLEYKYFIFITIKSFCIFLAWLCSFKALKYLPVSIYGILDLSRVLFATFLGIAFLNEKLQILQIFGLVFVSTGLLLLKFKPAFLKKIFKIQDEQPATLNEQKNHSTTFYVILALTACILNAVSGFLDKILMNDMSSSQLQFWYTLFIAIYYCIYILFKKIKISSSIWKNGWVWLLAIMFVIGDKALFIANGYPESKITIMTLIKQSGCLVTILGGKFIFKEKNISYKLFCATVIICGIILGLI